MGNYRWVHHEDEILFEVGIRPDGTLHNPRGYPEDLVRAAVIAADERKRQRRSRAAQKGAATRKRRKEHRVHLIAQQIVRDEGCGPRAACAVCGRALDDPRSVERGIGPECWQGVLEEVERLKIAERARV